MQNIDHDIGLKEKRKYFPTKIGEKRENVILVLAPKILCHATRPYIAAVSP
jgi:hypothetical protein